MQEFDDIYDTEITKRYDKHEIQRLSQRKVDRKRRYGAGRPFKLNVKNGSVHLRDFIRTCYLKIF